MKYQDLGVGDPAGVVDAHMQVLPPCTPYTPAPVPVDPVPDPLDPGQFLDVQVDELASLVDIGIRRCSAMAAFVQRFLRRRTI